MKIKIRKTAEEKKAADKKLVEWHWKFAIRPRYINGYIVWFSSFARRVELDYWGYKARWDYKIDMLN